MKQRLLLTHTLERPYNLPATMALLSLGSTDPTMQFATGSVRMAMLAPHGPLEVLVEQRGAELRALGVGEDEDLDWAATRMHDWLGLSFVPPQFPQGPRKLQTLAKRWEGLRLPRSPLLFARLVQIVLQQLISFEDAAYGWRQLVRSYGQQHLPFTGLSAPPAARALSTLATSEFVACSVLPQHGRRIAGLAKRANKLETLWNGGEGEGAVERTSRLLAKLPGVGKWTLGHLQGAGMGHSDAVTLGDYSLPHFVAYFFTGKERSTDEEMLQLLAPYGPHRYYVLALLDKGAKRPPRRGPRHRRLRDHMGT